jgi:tRNA threonylcarbamoyladenosine biosynthesis protein TsaB
MSLVLNIDTALESASICLARDEEIISLAINENPKGHAAWLHSTVADMLQKNNYTPNQLEAIAVSIGPGSYTGLRVGLSAAKGFCYALHIPLIAINTLKVIAFAVKDEATNLICPMIDARRMEVFVAIYDKFLRENSAARALLLDETSFSSLLSTDKILFCGTGSKKLQPLLTNVNASFSNTSSNASHLAALAQISFINKEYADLAYTEPLYLKEFYSPVSKK